MTTYSTVTRTSCTAATALLLSTTLACGGGSSSGSGTANNDTSNSDTENSGTETTAGEEFDLLVHVPEGAIEGDFQASVVEADPDDYPFPGGDFASPVYEIGPSGTQFLVPVTVGVPIDPDTPAGSSIELMRFDEADGEWVSLPGAMIVDNMIVAQTEHFSPFGAVMTSSPGCDNIWSGGPGNVAPLLEPGQVVVTPGVRTDEDLVASGSSMMALGSTWTTDACTVTISGEFGSGLTGEGAWKDWVTGNGGAIAQNGGSFSFDLYVGAPNGPYYALTDPCNAPSGFLYNLNIHPTVACEDPCDGVTCDMDDGDPCTVDTCNPATGTCEQQPSTGACGSNGAGLCVQGLCMLEVLQTGALDGNGLCAAEGLTCDSSPTLDPASEACLAFHPSASVSMDVNGWSQGIYCDNNMGNACEGVPNDCHHCPACLDGLNCTTLGSDLMESLFVSCVP